MPWSRPACNGPRPDTLTLRAATRPAEQSAPARFRSGRLRLGRDGHDRGRRSSFVANRPKALREGPEDPARPQATASGRRVHTSCSKSPNEPNCGCMLQPCFPTAMPSSPTHWTSEGLIAPASPEPPVQARPHSGQVAISGSPVPAVPPAPIESIGEQTCASASEAAQDAACRRRAAEIRASRAASRPAANTTATTATAIISRRTVNRNCPIAGASETGQQPYPVPWILISTRFMSNVTRAYAAYSALRG